MAFDVRVNDKHDKNSDVCFWRQKQTSLSCRCYLSREHRRPDLLVYWPIDNVENLFLEQTAEFPYLSVSTCPHLNIVWLPIPSSDYHLLTSSVRRVVEHVLAIRPRTMNHPYFRVQVLGLVRDLR